MVLAVSSALVTLSLVQGAVFFVPSSTRKFGPSSFPSLLVTTFERRMIGPGVRRIFGRLSL